MVTPKRGRLGKLSIMQFGLGIAWQNNGFLASYKRNPKKNTPLTLNSPYFNTNMHNSQTKDCYQIHLDDIYSRQAREREKEGELQRNTHIERTASKTQPTNQAAQSKKDKSTNCQNKIANPGRCSIVLPAASAANKAKRTLIVKPRKDHSLPPLHSLSLSLTKITSLHLPTSKKRHFEAPKNLSRKLKLLG